MESLPSLFELVKNGTFDDSLVAVAAHVVGPIRGVESWDLTLYGEGFEPLTCDPFSFAGEFLHQGHRCDRCWALMGTRPGQPRIPLPAWPGQMLKIVAHQFPQHRKIDPYVASDGRPVDIWRQPQCEHGSHPFCVIRLTSSCGTVGTG